MRFIHCTQKLTKELPISLTDPDKVPAVSEGLGDWYANLLRFSRTKCLLFTNEKTLYSFFIPGILKKDLRDIKGIFLGHFSNNLQHEGFGPEVVNRLLQEYQEVGFAKTASRRVLGFMNDFAIHYEFFIWEAGGIENMPLLETNAKINRTPLSAGKEAFCPMDRVRELFSKLS